MERAAASGSAIDAYQRHYRGVLKRQRGGEVDLSRVDSMIAVRMRVTGHDQAAIEGALRQCAPATRQKDEGRDGNDYAQRTARYAYSAAGDRQAADLGKTGSSGKSWKAASHSGIRSRPRRREDRARQLARHESVALLVGCAILV